MRAITIDADTGKRVYTRKEVADLVGASTQSIRLWEDAGAIPAMLLCSMRSSTDFLRLLTQLLQGV